VIPPKEMLDSNHTVDSGWFHLTVTPRAFNIHPEYFGLEINLAP
jgi:hypothetical protein